MKAQKTTTAARIDCALCAANYRPLAGEIKVTFSVNTPVLDFYRALWPSDDMGKEISPSLTFAAIVGFNFVTYKALGVNDSLIRERVETAAAMLTA